MKNISLSKFKLIQKFQNKKSVLSKISDLKIKICGCKK